MADKKSPVPDAVKAAMDKGLRQRYALGIVGLPKGKGK